MPDRRSARGPHPRDAEAFAPMALPVLREAVDDLCWLLSRGYGAKQARRLVADRHRLLGRQRKALQRTAASDEERRLRGERRVEPAEVAGEPVAIDGYNVLLTVEAALSGGVLLRARDGTMRDLAAMSRHYRRVEQTRDAIERIGLELAALGAAEVEWALDSPVSNSRRLAGLLREVGAKRSWPWRIELVERVDARLIASEGVVASADSVVLDRCARWLNLARLVVEERVAEAWVVEV